MDYLGDGSLDILASAEEIKIITSCIQRIPTLQHALYKINREEKDGKIILGISFGSEGITATDVELFQKFLERDVFEYCTKHEYQIQVGDNLEQKDGFNRSCEELIKHIKTQFGSSMSFYMRLIDVELRPTLLGRLEKGLFHSNAYSLVLQIRATHPNNSYLLPEEEIELAQKKCIEYVVGLHNIAAKYVRRVSIITN